MYHNIKVNVVGPMKSGKSKIVKIIEEATAGMGVVVTEQNDLALAPAAQNSNRGESEQAGCQQRLVRPVCDPDDTISQIMFGDLGKDPNWIHTESKEGREKGVEHINDIVWKLDAITQNKSLEWKLRMMSARISKYIDTVMDQKDHCGLVPLFP